MIFRALNALARRPIVRYACIGTIAAALDISFFALFANSMEFPYLWVAATGFLLATLVNYILGLRFVFTSRSKHSRRVELGMVYLVSLFGLLLHQWVLYWMVEHGSETLMVAKLTATGSVFFWNYLARKHFIFAERPLA